MLHVFIVCRGKWFFDGWNFEVTTRAGENGLSRRNTQHKTKGTSAIFVFITKNPELLIAKEPLSS